MNTSASNQPTKFMADWRWYCQTVSWPSDPMTFQRFWGKVGSYQILHLWCETEIYEAKWKDALMFQLSQVWMVGPVPGRLAKDQQPLSESVLESITILDMIVQGLIGAATVNREVKNAESTFGLIKHFFPEDIALTDEIRDHIYGRGGVTEDVFLKVLMGSSASRKEIDYRRV